MRKLKAPCVCVCGRRNLLVGGMVRGLGGEHLEYIHLFVSLLPIGAWKISSHAVTASHVHSRHAQCWNDR